MAARRQRGLVIRARSVEIPEGYEVRRLSGGRVRLRQGPRGPVTVGVCVCGGKTGGCAIVLSANGRSMSCQKHDERPCSGNCGLELVVVDLPSRRENR